jgi:hypothetical protein
MLIICNGGGKLMKRTNREKKFKIIIVLLLIFVMCGCSKLKWKDYTKKYSTLFEAAPTCVYNYDSNLSKENLNFSKIYAKIVNDSGSNPGIYFKTDKDSSYYTVLNNKDNTNLVVEKDTNKLTYAYMKTGAGNFRFYRETDYGDNYTLPLSLIFNSNSLTNACNDKLYLKYYLNEYEFVSSSDSQYKYVFTLDNTNSEGTTNSSSTATSLTAGTNFNSNIKCLENDATKCVNKEIDDKENNNKFYVQIGKTSSGAVYLYGSASEKFDNADKCTYANASVMSNAMSVTGITIGSNINIYLNDEIFFNDDYYSNANVYFKYNKILLGSEYHLYTTEKVKSISDVSTGGSDFDKLNSDQNCAALLGDPSVSTYPAYWLNLAISILRYAAIIALLVLSSYDFIRAIISQDGDALKKATNHLYKRLLYCVIIFFIPTILNYIFKVVGIEGVCTEIIE